MDIPFREPVVRWDVPASLLSRLTMPAVLGTVAGEVSRDDVRRFERRITLGFQLMAGWYRGKIAKNVVETLPKDVKAIPWGTAEFDGLMNDSIRFALDQDQFRYWSRWGLSIIDLMSDAVALDFILVLANDWERKGTPRVAGAQFGAYQRNARVLLDRLVHDYCVGKWRGSSNSRIASEIDALQKGDAPAFEPVPEEDWVRLANELVDEGTIAGAQYANRPGPDPRMRLLLGYMNVVTRLWPSVEEDAGQELDHIIPASEFAAVPDTSPVKSMKNHIVNLALLPKSVNNSKSNRKLADVQSDADQELIAQYEVASHLQQFPREKHMSEDRDLELRPLDDSARRGAGSQRPADGAEAIRSVQDLEAVYDIPVQVSAVLGRATMEVSQLLKLGRGAVVELDRKVGEAIDIYVNNRLVARGEVVVVEDRLGVTMTEIVKGERA